MTDSFSLNNSSSYLLDTWRTSIRLIASIVKLAKNMLLAAKLALPKLMCKLT
jgi:hypothetical protein